MRVSLFGLQRFIGHYAGATAVSIFLPARCTNLNQRVIRFNINNLYWLYRSYPTILWIKPRPFDLKLHHGFTADSQSTTLLDGLAMSPDIALSTSTVEVAVAQSPAGFLARRSVTGLVTRCFHPCARG